MTNVVTGIERIVSLSLAAGDYPGCGWPGLLARPAWVVLKQRLKVVHLRDVFSSSGQYTINQNPIQR